MGFPGFPEEGLAFLASLGRNNRTEWFQARRGVYQEAVRGPMLAMVEGLNLALQRFAPDYQARLPGAISRPNRDTRFSKDKSPYRTDISAVFPFRGRPKQEVAGFFVRVSPREVEIIAGSFVPGPEQLSRVRRWIDRHPRQLEGVLAAQRLRRLMGELQGDGLKKIPRGFAADHEAGDLLRRIQWYLRATLPAEAARAPGLLGEVSRRFEVAEPFVAVLDRALGIR